MTRYIGLDAHATSCTFVVIDSHGKTRATQVVETHGRTLQQVVRLVPRPRHLCFEEGGLSAWLYELLSPLVDAIVVLGLQHKTYGTKNDRRDAQGLADRLRRDDVPCSVYKPNGQYARLRALVRTHDTLVKAHVRAKLQVKALFRNRGIPTAGERIYTPKHRDLYLRQLPATLTDSARLHYQHLDDIRASAREAKALLRDEARAMRAVTLLQTIPGVGLIRAAQIVAIVVSPHRFRTRRQLWSYAGLAVVTRSSSDWEPKNGRLRPATGHVQTLGLNRNHNHRLKDVFKGAALCAVHQCKTPNPFQVTYQRLVDNKTRPSLAQVSVARKIAACALALWKSNTVYDPGYGR